MASFTIPTVKVTFSSAGVGDSCAPAPTDEAIIAVIASVVRAAPSFSKRRIVPPFEPVFDQPFSKAER
jgi:hypothetical protein